jgi:hypothetical protein
MRLFPALCAGLLVVAASPVIAGTTPNDRAEARLAKALDGRIAGEPVDCIQLHDIDSTEIFDNTAILYRTIGGTVYLNRPRSGLSSLNNDDILVTKSWTPELCSIDTVSLVDRTSRFPSGFVFLSEFVPYKKVTTSK